MTNIIKVRHKASNSFSGKILKTEEEQKTEKIEVFYKIQELKIAEENDFYDKIGE